MFVWPLVHGTFLFPTIDSFLHPVESFNHTRLPILSRLLSLKEIDLTLVPLVFFNQCEQVTKTQVIRYIEEAQAYMVEGRWSNLVSLLLTSGLQLTLFLQNHQRKVCKTKKNNLKWFSHFSNRDLFT